MKKALFICTLIPIILLAGCGGGGGTTYTAKGCGVIMEAAATKSRAAAWLPPFLKEVNPGDLAPGRAIDAGNAGFARTAIPPLDVTAYPSFFYLAWNKKSGADRYLVYYGTEVVWDSDASHYGDPAYSENSPAAYIDLDQSNELNNLITAAGAYTFEVVALAGGSEVQRYPAVTLSLGQALRAFPAGTYQSAGQQIALTGVAGAGGYRVLVYTGGWGERLEYNSALLPNTAVSYNLTYTAYTSGSYYNYKIDAHALDTTGTATEIVRAIDGFTYSAP